MPSLCSAVFEDSSPSSKLLLEYKNKIKQTKWDDIKVQRQSLCFPWKKHEALHKLIKVCMFALRLWVGCLQHFLLTQSLIFTAVAKCLELLSRLWAFSQHFKGDTWGDIFLTTVMEDNKRFETAWAGLGRNAQGVSVLLSLGGTRNYEKFRAAAEFVWDVRCQRQHLKSHPLCFTKT